MNDEKLVSIIIPIYNVEIYLKKCIDTVIKQTYKNIEIILVDDGSPDGCAQICDDYKKKDSRIKVIHKTNGGLSDARNAGIVEATGQYITFIDSDDYVTNNYVEVLLELINRGNADISIANRYDLKNGEIIVNDYYKPMKNDGCSSEQIFQHFCNDTLPHEAWAKMYKKEIFESSKYTKGLKVYEDIEFILNLLYCKNYKINYDTSKYIYYYRDRDNSIMKEKYNSLWNQELRFYYDLYCNNEKVNINDSIKNIITRISVRNIKLLIKNYDLDKTVYNEAKKIFKITLKLDIRSLKKNLSKKRYYYLLLFKTFPFILDLIIFLKKARCNYKNIRIKKYIRRQRKSNNVLHIIFNAPTTGNLGDHAILYGEEKYLNDNGKKSISVSSKEMEYFFNGHIDEMINENDYMYITGGGNTGTLWRNEQSRINMVMDKLYRSNIVIFPQTIYYSNDEFGEICLKSDLIFYNKCKKLNFQCRDLNSYNFVKKYITSNVELKRDMALYLDYSNKYNYKRSGIILCFRNDKEKTLNDIQIKKIIKSNEGKKISYIDTVKTKKSEYSYHEAKKEFIKLIKQFKHSELVITDRLHAMIICAITNTPCEAHNNSSGKVKGVYETIKDDKKFIKFVEQVK